MERKAKDMERGENIWEQNPNRNILLPIWAKSAENRDIYKILKFGGSVKLGTSNFVC